MHTEGFVVKRYLTTIFVIASMIVVFIGMKSEVRWAGIATWAIAFLLLMFAAYFTKYIPNKNNNEEQERNFVESE